MELKTRTLLHEGEVPVVLIQMLLPTKGADVSAFSDDMLAQTRDELIDRFGGLTAYMRSPAAGAWTSPEGHVEEDSVVMIEVIADTFDVGWWRPYAEKLKQRFAQETVHVRACEVQVLEN
jgi:hypothetical protein